MIGSAEQKTKTLEGNMIKETKWIKVGLIGISFIFVFIMVVSVIALAEPNDYPTQKIRIIVPYKPGGGSDTRARLMEKIIRENNLLPVPVVIINIPGGGAAPGQLEVINAKPDGYTLLLHHGQVIIGHLLDILDWNYDAFAPVAEITENPIVVCTHASSPWKRFTDLIEDAEQRPGKITWSWGGMGGHTHFTSLAIFKGKNIKVRPVAHGGAAESKAALAGRQVDVAVFGVVPMDYIKAGRFRALAVASDERMPQLPDVPTLKEQGVDVSVSIRYSLFAPKGTPEERLIYLQSVVKRVCENPEFVEKIHKIGGVVKYRPGQEMFDQFAKDYELFKEVAAEIKIKR